MEESSASGVVTSPWLDAVHAVGIAGELLAIAALAGGLYILLVLSRGGFQRRARVRLAHMVAGGVAAALALAHVAGRAAQEGQMSFAPDAAHLATVAFVLLALSGVLRHWPPAFLQDKPAATWWVHRGLVVAAFLTLVLHVVDEVRTYAMD